MLARLLACSLVVAGLAQQPDESIDAKNHWAFQPPKRPPVPLVKNAAWVRNPIDAFVAHRHEQLGLTPSPEASRCVLLRRLSLDLIGLPPAPEDLDGFEKDASPDAYERVVERLLASPHYGERWARHWLDVARWAESEGYESNHTRPHAWRYRDYVVRSFNADKPFDRFVREQIAGDEMRPYADENLIATGFLAGARFSSNEEDRPRQRNDMLVDIVNAAGNAFLGLTVHCAQCHNHRFDPVTIRDYYRFQGFFLKGQIANLALRDDKECVAYFAARPADYEPTRQAMEKLQEAGREILIARARKELPAETLRVLDTPEEKRTPQQHKLADEADLNFQFGVNQVEGAIPADRRQEYDALKKQLAAMEKTMPNRPQTFGYYSPATSPTPVEVLPMKGFYPLPYLPKALARARPYVWTAGDVHRRGPEVDVGWPGIFGPVPAGAVAKTPRLALADWLTRPDHPLTARVYVNRLWQYHFGRGLVATPGDFGLKGTPPTHPELLDWLATELVRGGWSTKHLHRLIVTSNTYRQASRPNAANAKIDPDNKAWWRWRPRRLEAEAVRDSLLAVSGELDRTAGGRSDADDARSLRRSLYLFQRRGKTPAFQPLFDGPQAVLESCPCRHVSTVPSQALYLLNNPFAVRRAEAFAGRVRREAGEEGGRQVRRAFLLALGREPTPEDQEASRRFFRGHAGEGALAHYCQALLNVNEFLYVE